MKEILISIILGMLPECLFYTYFWIMLKQLKNKRILLFILICIIYFSLIMIKRYEVLYYFLFGILMYLILKILYKEKTNFLDIFVFYASCTYIFFISCFCISIILNYQIAYIVNRILLLFPFIFYKQIISIYKKYMCTWNKETNISKYLRSITIRVGTIMLLSSFIIISSQVCLYISNMKGG